MGFGDGKDGMRPEHPSARPCLPQPVPRLPAHGEDVRGIGMEQRAGTLGQTGRREQPLPGARSETCPVYLGHGPKPQPAAGPTLHPLSAMDDGKGMSRSWSPGSPLHPPPWLSCTLCTPHPAPPSPGCHGGTDTGALSWAVKRSSVCGAPGRHCQHPGAVGQQPGQE